MAKIKKTIWNYLPYLHLYIAFPFFSVRTAIMWRQYDANTIEYIVLHIHIFKWKFEFRLYDTFIRINDR